MNKQHGFGTFIVLLVIIVITVVTANVWYVWNRSAGSKTSTTESIGQNSDQNTNRTATDTIDYYAEATEVTSDSISSRYHGECNYAALAKQYFKEQEGVGTIADILFIQSPDGKYIARAEARISDEFPFGNYSVLYINDELIEDDMRTKYDSVGGLFPLYWTQDNNRLILSNYHSTGHGGQEIYQLYSYDVNTRNMTKIAELEGSPSKVVTTCTGDQKQYVGYSIDGSYGRYRSPHKIAEISLYSGEVRELLSVNEDKALPSFSELKLSEDGKVLTYSLRVLKTLPEDSFYDLDAGYDDVTGSIDLY